MRQIELLAPAKNLECGIAAIDHGADAVYIGPERFGARASAVNSLNDIKALCNYAHMYGAKVYVTLNTIVYSSELTAVEQLVRQIGTIGVDAVLVQDMAVAEMVKSFCPEIAIHASTQTDNRNSKKVAWLQDQGFSRVVLARELSLEDITTIHNAVPNVELETFVHGALCVSYSGACYASQYCFHRSANRGECAQFCRLSFDLVDENQHCIAKDLHLLSLKDLCLIDKLEELLTAGVTSLKIEGRLKDVIYVKNVVAAYSQRLNSIIRKHHGHYVRSSYGNVIYKFKPDLKKTFNRGYTTYFFTGRQAEISSFYTPKALGEFVGKVKDICGNSFTIAGLATFTNGDGLCFINKERKLEGFRINKVLNNKIIPFRMPSNLQAGISLYRNNNQAFESLLSKKSAERRIGINFNLSLQNRDLILSAIDESGRQAIVRQQIELQQALKPQQANIEKQLSKLGTTIFQIQTITMEDAVSTIFVPSSILAQLRREIIEQIEQMPFPQVKNDRTTLITKNNRLNTIEWRKDSSIYAKLNIDNVANQIAQTYYINQGMTDVPIAPEMDGRCLLPTFESHQKPLMTCRHCLRFALGKCLRHGGERPSWHEPLHLRLSDGRLFRLAFDCQKCEMKVYAEN